MRPLLVLVASLVVAGCGGSSSAAPGPAGPPDAMGRPQAPATVTLKQTGQPANNVTDLTLTLDVRSAFAAPLQIGIAAPLGGSVLGSPLVESVDASSPGRIVRTYHVQWSGAPSAEHPFRVVVDGGADGLGFRTEKQFPRRPEIVGAAERRHATSGWTSARPRAALSFEEIVDETSLRPGSAWPLAFAALACASACSSTQDTSDDAGAGGEGGSAGSGGDSGTGGSAGSGGSAGDDGGSEAGGGGSGGGDGGACTPEVSGTDCGSIPPTGVCTCGSTTRIQYCQEPAVGDAGAATLTTIDCPPDYACQISATDGVAECVYTKACVPGDRYCDANGLEVCRADGSGYDATACTTDQQCTTPPGGLTDCYALTNNAGGIQNTLTGTVQYELRSLTKAGLSSTTKVTGAFLEFVAVYDGNDYIGSAITDGDGNFTANLSKAPSANAIVYVYAMDFYPGTQQPLIAVAHNAQTSVSGASARTGTDYWHWSTQDTCLGTPITVVPNTSTHHHTMSSNIVIPESCGSGAVRVFQWSRFALNWLSQLPATQAAKQRSIVLMWEPGVDKSCGDCFQGPWSGGGSVLPPGATQPDYFDTVMQVSGSNANPSQWAYSVISHETGHWVMSNYSASPMEGGPHYVDQLDTPGLAYSEGFATAFGQRNVSDIANGEHDPVYIDVQDDTTFWIDISIAKVDDTDSLPMPKPTGPISQNINENVVAETLWYLWQTTGPGSGPYQGIDDGNVFKALQSKRLLKNATYNRGYTTADLVDFFDSATCSGAATDANVSAVSQFVGFPWDSSPNCP